MIIFLAILLYVYAFLPEKVGLWFDGFGMATFSAEREAFFYACISIILVVNLVAHIFYRTISLVPIAQGTIISSDTMKNNLSIWAAGFSLILNITMILSVSFIGLYYNSEHFNINYFSFLVFVGPILLISWFFVLIYFLLGGNKNSSVNE